MPFVIPSKRRTREKTNVKTPTRVKHVFDTRDPISRIKIHARSFTYDQRVTMNGIKIVRSFPREPDALLRAIDESCVR